MSAEPQEPAPPPPPPPHHHHHHHRHQQRQIPRPKMVQLKSIERITTLPVVESAAAYYDRIKKSNILIKLSLLPAETGLWLAIGTAMPFVTFFKTPVSAVDNIACKALDIIEAKLPVVTYPPDLIYNISKDYVNNKVVTPMLNRADSVKQISINGAGLAADRLNSVINVADKYVDKYLPDITDGAEAPAEGPPPPASTDSKAAQTIKHVNQFSRKLQRRLTRRTIAEAKALKQQGADTIRCIIYLVDLLARDPKAFMEKMKAVWLELSKDEPENQAPPRNLEMLITLLIREIARRLVHLTNYMCAKMVLLSQYALHVAHIGALNAVWLADYFIKALHLGTAVEITATQITRLLHFNVDLMEGFIEMIKNLKRELDSADTSTSSPEPSLTTSTSTPYEVPPSHPPSLASLAAPVSEHIPPTPSPVLSSSSSSNPTSSRSFSSHNGDYAGYESNHEFLQ